MKHEPIEQMPQVNLRRPSWPKHCVRVTILPHVNEARVYLRSLGFDLRELVYNWRVKYCRRDPSAYPPVFNRVVVPFYDDSELLNRRKGPQWKFAGWQALAPRAAGSLEPPIGIAPDGMAASGMLYGLDKTIPGSGPVVLVSSVLDVWRLGGNAISTFGQPMSHAQENRIIAIFGNRPLVVATKNERDEERSHVANRLREKRAAAHDTSPVHVVRLTPLEDVFESWRRAATWQLIDEVMKE